MYTAQQFAMSEPLSETQGLDNKSNKKPNKQGKSKKDKDKYTLRACSIQKRIDVETKVGGLRKNLISLYKSSGARLKKTWKQKFSFLFNYTLLKILWTASISQ